MTKQQRERRRRKEILLFLAGIAMTGILVMTYAFGGKNALLRAEGDCDALGATKLWVQPYTCKRLKK